MRSVFTILFMFVCSLAFAVDPLPAARTPMGQGNWIGIAGVSNGIPTGQTQYTNFAAGASIGAINSALASCPSNKFVLLAAGDYNANNTAVVIEDNGVVLRGTSSNGIPLTRFTNCPASLAMAIATTGTGLPDWYDEAGQGTLPTHTNWTANYTQGTTVITLVSAAQFSVGQMIWLDQLNTTNDSNFGNAQGGVMAADEYSSLAHPDTGEDRMYKEGHRIIAKSGNDLTLDSGVYLPGFVSGNDPEAWRFTEQPIVNAGVENIEFDKGQIQLHLAYNCWVSNCIGSPGDILAQGGIRLFWSTRCTIDHCGVTTPTMSIDTYGIQTRSCSAILVQNCWSDRVGSGLMPNGSVAGVWAYNTITNSQSGSGVMAMGLLLHGGNPMMNLFEGNYVACIGFDNTWGSSSYNTAHRNRAVGWSVAGEATGNQQAVMCSATNRLQTFIGNVLGTTNKNTWLEDYAGDGVACHDDPGRVYAFGFWDTGCQEGPENGDPAVRSSVIKAYNWVSSTPGIIEDGFSAGEIPNSYYLSSKPSWFGNLTWPAVDPANAVYSSSYTNIPAGYREAFDSDPPAESSVTPNSLRLAGPIRTSGPLTVK